MTILITLKGGVVTCVRSDADVIDVDVEILDWDDLESGGEFRDQVYEDSDARDTLDKILGGEYPFRLF